MNPEISFQPSPIGVQWCVYDVSNGPYGESTLSAFLPSLTDIEWFCLPPNVDDELHVLATDVRPEEYDKARNPEIIAFGMSGASGTTPITEPVALAGATAFARWDSDGPLVYVYVGPNDVTKLSFPKFARNRKTKEPVHEPHLALMLGRIGSQGAGIHGTEDVT